jgi:hypothetical protein
MQMKKNYLLLFFIALLFGTATMRGQSLDFQAIKASAAKSPHIPLIVKIGKGYIFISGTEIKCVRNKENATDVDISTEDPNTFLSITGHDKGGSIKYNNKGVIKKSGTLLKFNFVSIDQRFYIKAAQPQSNVYGYFLTNKNGVLSFEEEKSEDAVVEITEVGSDLDKEGLTKQGEKYHNILALFQPQKHEKAYDETTGTPGRIWYTFSPLIGSGLGQYDKSEVTGNNWIESTEKEFRDEYTYDAGRVNMLKEVINSIKITPLNSGSYVIVSTKSPFEDEVRDYSKNRKTPIETVAGPSLPAQYLMASATGYTLTDDKSKAAVFYFDGEHLTGIDNGFGLGEAKYDLTANDQKAVIAQGKLEKTLDAGSYSLKVGDKFVKLDRDNGLSLSTSESDSHLFLEEATKFTLNTDDLGYISFFAPTAVKVPAGVEVYRGNINAQNSVITFNKVNTQQIPANTAVLLRKVTGKGSFEVEKTASTTSTIGNNSLKGYTVSSSDHLSNAYGLTVENNKLVFKPLTQGVRAFRAVIYSNTAAGAPAYYPTAFTPEGIQGVTVDDNQAEVFDLAGRRVEAPVKGQVYVKNGKKFIQK